MLERVEIRWQSLSGSGPRGVMLLHSKVVWKIVLQHKEGPGAALMGPLPPVILSHDPGCHANSLCHGFLISKMKTMILFTSQGCCKE